MDYLTANFYEGTVGEYTRFNVKEAVEKAYRLCNGVTVEEKGPTVNVYKKKVKF